MRLGSADDPNAGLALTRRPAPQPILLEPKIELSAREAEALGGARPVPAALAEHLCDGLALDCAEVGGDGARWLARAFESQVFRPNQPSFAQNGGALERVAKLAHVTWPVIPEQRLPGVSRKAGRRPPERPPDLVQQRLAEREDIGGARSERRDRDVEHFQAVVKVLAEVAAFDGFPQVTVGCRNHPNIRLHGARGPESLELAFL